MDIKNKIARDRTNWLILVLPGRISTFDRFGPSQTYTMTSLIKHLPFTSNTICKGVHDPAIIKFPSTNCPITCILRFGMLIYQVCYHSIEDVAYHHKNNLHPWCWTFGNTQTYIFILFRCTKKTAWLYAWRTVKVAKCTQYKTCHWNWYFAMLNLIKLRCMMDNLRRASEVIVVVVIMHGVFLKLRIIPSEDQPKSLFWNN